GPRRIESPGLMYAERANPAADAAIAERVRLRTMAQRKRRILFNLLAILLITAGMFYVVLWQRDDQAVKNIAEISDRVAGELRNEFDRTMRLPTSVPNLGPNYKNVAARYRFNTVYVQQ